MRYFESKPKERSTRPSEHVSLLSTEVAVPAVPWYHVRVCRVLVPSSALSELVRFLLLRQGDARSRWAAAPTFCGGLFSPNGKHASIHYFEIWKHTLRYSMCPGTGKLRMLGNGHPRTIIAQLYIYIIFIYIYILIIISSSIVISV